MPFNDFQEWTEKRKLLQEYADNPLLNMEQKEGDKIYFGIHDLNRYYREHGNIPELEFSDIMDKTGEVSDTDPVDSKVLVTVERDPFHFGYHNLETKSQRERRKKQEGLIQVNIPSDWLVDISHLIEGEHKVWLVVDQKTKYQAGLMKQIRKREMKAYMDKDTASGLYDLDDEESPIDLEVEERYKFMNREIEPYYQFKASFDPSISSYSNGWKYHIDAKRYAYYAE
jgi:hypothetical protein